MSKLWVELLSTCIVLPPHVFREARVGLLLAFRAIGCEETHILGEMLVHDLQMNRVNVMLF